MATTRQSTDDQAWRTLITLHGRIEQDLAKVLQRKHALGLSEYRALSALAGADDYELRIQDLAGAVGLNQSSVSRLVARLQDAGLTERTMCPTDRRGVYTQLTEQGHERLRAALPAYQETLTAALDGAAGDPDLASIVGVLRETL